MLQDVTAGWWPALKERCLCSAPGSATRSHGKLLLAVTHSYSRFRVAQKAAQLMQFPRTNSLQEFRLRLFPFYLRAFK